MYAEVFKKLLTSIEEYKNSSGKSYEEIARELGIPPKSFANLRTDWRNNRGLPNKKTREKLKKIVNFF